MTTPPPDTPDTVDGMTLHDAEVMALESRGDTPEQAEAAVAAAEAAAAPDAAKTPATDADADPPPDGNR